MIGLPTTIGGESSSTFKEKHSSIVKQFISHFDKNLEGFLRLLLEKR